MSEASAKELFNQLLQDVVAATNAIAAEVERSADEEFASTAFAVLALAISTLGRSQRETMLRDIETGELREAVERFSQPPSDRWTQ